MAKYADIEKAVNQTFCPPEGEIGCIIELPGEGHDEIVVTLTSLSRSESDFMFGEVFKNGNNEGYTDTKYTCNAELVIYWMKQILEEDEELQGDPKVKIIIVDSSENISNMTPLFSDPEINYGDDNFKEFFYDTYTTLSHNEAYFFYYLLREESRWSETLKESGLKNYITKQHILSMYQLNLDNLVEKLDKLGFKYEQSDLELFEELLEKANKVKITHWMSPKFEKVEVDEDNFGLGLQTITNDDLDGVLIWDTNYAGYNCTLMGTPKGL